MADFPAYHQIIFRDEPRTEKQDHLIRAVLIDAAPLKCNGSSWNAIARCGKASDHQS